LNNNNYVNLENEIPSMLNWN